MTTEQVITKNYELITECIGLELEIRDIAATGELAANGLKGAMIAVNDAEKCLRHAYRCLNFTKRNS